MLSKSMAREELIAEVDQILPHLKPRAFDNGADLLGAHCEGPWLNPLKKGAHGIYHMVRCGIAKW